MNNNSIAKWTNILKVVLAVIGVVACIFLFFGPNTNTATVDEVAEFRDGGQMGFATGFTIAILFICLALVLIFFVVQLITNPKKTLMSIIGIVLSLVVYLIIYAMGTSDTDESLGLVSSVGKVDASTITSTTAGIWTIFVSLGVAVLVIIQSFVQRILNR